MPTLEKAKFDLLEDDFKTLQKGTTVFVQFNPESLKVSLSNQIQQPKNAGDQTGPPSMQFVGAGTMKMAVQLWFDAASASQDDVRPATKKIRNLITPQPGKEKGSFIPPFVSFSWGTFRFDGILESLEETLEFFSPDGKPLRASVSVSMINQKLQFFPGEDRAAKTAGNKPLASAPQGASLQSMATSAGQGGNWQAIAAANGIDNPRQLATGQLIDLNAGISGSVGVSVSAGITLGANGAGGVVSGGISLGAGVNVGFDVG